MGRPFNSVPITAKQWSARTCCIIAEPTFRNNSAVAVRTPELASRASLLEAHMRKITFVVEPAVGRPGYFAASLDGVGLCISREPLLSAARELIRHGAPPDTILAMRHAGSDHDALRGQLGALAKLTVQDGQDGAPRLRRWRPSPYGGVPSPMRFAPAAPQP